MIMFAAEWIILGVAITIAVYFTANTIGGKLWRSMISERFATKEDQKKLDIYTERRSRYAEGVKPDSYICPECGDISEDQVVQDKWDVLRCSKCNSKIKKEEVGIE